eukprot:gene2134-2631_t
MSNEKQILINQSIEFVKEELKGNDPSHDYEHVERVWNNAKYLAEKEGITDEDDLEIIEIAAILHDVRDYKYSGDENAGEHAVGQFLKQFNYPQMKIDKVCRIVKEISFKNEVGSSGSGENTILKESMIVQDADRLDAIGAIGIARCFAFGSVKGSKFYNLNHYPAPLEEGGKLTNLTKEEYLERSKLKAPIIDHFYDKLFKLSGMMKTKTGKELAQQRHDFMVQFIKQFGNELFLNQQQQK